MRTWGLGWRRVGIDVILICALSGLGLLPEVEMVPDVGVVIDWPRLAVLVPIFA